MRTMLFWAVFLKVETKTPKAKALESIVPIKAAIRETVSNDDSQLGNDVNTFPINKFEGSVTTPESLKLIPR